MAVSRAEEGGTRVRGQGRRRGELKGRRLRRERKWRARASERPGKALLFFSFLSRRHTPGPSVSPFLTLSFHTTHFRVNILCLANAL
jgi:hypothetical protein